MVLIKKEGVLLEPTNFKFENHGVFNPAAVEANGQMHLLYRATSKANYSTIGYATLKSPTEIGERSLEPIVIPQEPYESQGTEDPRIVEIDGLFYLTYTAYDGTNALGALATSKDLKTFSKEGIITPKFTFRDYQLCVEACDGLSDKYLRFVKLFYARGGADVANKLFIWDKDVMFFPRKIKGKFAFLHRIYPDIQIAYFNELSDLTYQYWKDYLFNINKYIVLSGKMPFEASYIGGGCPPIETPEGWLLIYHGVEDTQLGYVYHAGAALLDLDDPTKEIGRLENPLFSPEHDWEKIGVVNNVVFPTGAILKDERLYIYYGAADKRIGTVSLDLQELINEIKNQKS